MIANSNRSKLFNESGCLSREALRLFLSSRLLEDDIKAVEGHVASCPLCKDALEGIRLFSQSQYHLAEEKAPFGAVNEVAESIRTKDSMPMDLDTHTERINRRLRQRFGYFPGSKKAAARSPRLRNFLIPAAASIIILVSIISYFHFLYPDKNDLALLGDKELNTSDEGKSEMIGGVFKEEILEKEAPETSRGEKGIDEAAVKDVGSMPEEEVIVTDEIAMVEETVMLADPEKDVEQSEPVIKNETVTANALEGVAGAGLNIEDGKAVSRAKSGKKAAAETNEMIVVYDQSASFPGGVDSLYRFLDRFMKYSVVDEEDADAVILVQFAISKRGNVDSFTLIQGAGEEVNTEVLRVLKVMPDWIPATKEGKNVAEVVSLPIYIKTK